MRRGSRSDRGSGAPPPGEARRRADLIVLDRDEPALAEQPLAHVLDAAIFGPCRRPVRDVMCGGRFIVREGHHAREQDVFRRFRAAVARFDVGSGAR